MSTNNLKFGTETPTKLYMGESEVTKAYMGEVLVYDQSFQPVTYILNDTLNTPLPSTTIKFKSNNKEFTRLGRTTQAGEITFNYYQADGTMIQFYNYNTKTYIDTNYKTITFLEEPTGALLTWLNNEATKQ